MAQLVIEGNKQEINALSLLLGESLDEILEAIQKDEGCLGTIQTYAGILEGIEPDVDFDDDEISPRHTIAL